MDKGVGYGHWRRLSAVGAGWLLWLGLSGGGAAAAVHVAAEVEAATDVAVVAGVAAGGAAAADVVAEVGTEAAANVAATAAVFAEGETAADEPSFGDELAEWWAGLKDEILGLFEQFDSYLSRTRLLTVGELQSLPVGLQTKMGQTVCDLLVTEAVFGPDYTELTVFLRLTTPSYGGGETKLYFGSENIRISSQGGFFGNLKLALLSEVSIGGKGGAFRLVLDPACKRGDLPPTYAVVDCDGFKEMQLNGRVIVPQTFARPVFQGQALENRELEMSFSCRATGLDDIMAELEVPEFALTALPDWRFEAKRTILDFSILENAPAMDYYNLPGVKLYDGFPEMWTGLYLEDLTVHFPSYVQNRKLGGSPVFAVDRLWLDENGFSGVMAARDVLTYKQGSLDSWSFSVDEIDITMVANKLKKGGMKGVIGIPLSVQANFGYEADFKTDGSWDMKVKMGERTSFDLWKSLDVELFATSYIKVEKKAADTSVRLTANLSGKMLLDPMAKSASDVASGSVDDTGSGKKKTKGKLSLGEIAFSNLKVSNRAPYLEVGKLELKGEARMGNFPVTLDKVNFSVKNLKSQLGFGMKVDLMQRNANIHVAGDLDFSIQSIYSPKTQDSGARWKFDGFHLGKLKVDVETPVFSIKGGAAFFEDHKQYGDGFKGELDFKMKTGMEFGLEALVMFGSMPTYRYWYADMVSNFGGAGMPVYPGFQISGLGGGAYQHMRMESDEEGPNMGERLTQSGLRYLPDSTKALAFKAYCQLSTQGNPQMFESDLGFSIGFLKSGGLDHITLQGVAKFMSQVEMPKLADMTNRITMALESDSTKWETLRRASTADASMTATALFTYDHSNRSFYGKFDTYINAGPIKGTGSGGYAGACEMYFSKPKWFIHIGHPNHRLGLKLDLGLLNVSTGSYFVTGNDLPAMPSLPSKLNRLLTPNELRNMRTRPVADIQGGKGFAFGSSLAVNTGNLNCWVLYARFESEIGFDIMMKKYKGVFCGGKTEVLGMNGWYATGQAYAYLYGGIGLRIKLFGRERHFTVLQGEVGAMLEAQLPRPSYFGGGFGLNFSVLGGLFRGNCQFKFSLGEKCEMVESGFADGMEVISDLRPLDKATEVDVFVMPQAAFNLPVDKPAQAVFDGEETEIRIKMDEFSLTPMGGTGAAGKITWDDERQLASWIPQEMLAPQTTYQWKVKVSGQEKGSGQWRDMQTIEGGVYTESRQQSFTTGKAPDSIPFRNIVRMYPVHGQHYLYTKESEKGWVKLQIGQSYLLEDDQYRKRVYFIDENGDTLQSAFTYDKAARQLNFRLPDLQRSMAYTMQFVLQEVGEVSGGGATRKDDEQRDGDNVLVKSQTFLAGDAVQACRDKLILQLEFSTSRYATLSEKMHALSFVRIFRVPYIHVLSDGTYQPSPIVHYLQAEMKAAEGFDKVELEGNAWSGGPMIEGRATMADAYYRQQIYPLVYEHYPYGGLVSFGRNPEHPEIVPDWAIYVSSYYVDERTDFFPWMYYLPYHYHRDFESVLLGIADNRKTKAYKSWLNRPFPSMPAGDYRIRFAYRLPNGQVGTQTEVNMKNEVE